MENQNYSGFSGYSIANLYPNMGNKVTQNMETTPEPEEQQSYIQIDRPAQPSVSKQKKSNMMGLLIVAIVLLLAFNIGG